MKRRPARAKNYRGALGDINGDSSFIQPPLKVAEL